MAPHAGEAREGIVAELVRLLGPSPGRLEYAARLALICALTTLVVEIYQTPSAALSAYVVFFLNKPDRAESVLLDLAFILLVTLIIAFIMLVAMAVVDAPLWRVIAMIVSSFTLLFLTSASKLRPLGAIIALIIAYAFDLLGTFHSGEIATRALLYVWLFIGIPTGVSLIVNLLLAPAPRKLAERAIAVRLRAAASMLRAPGERTRRALTEYLHEGSSEVQKWLKLAEVEKTSPARDIAALRHAAQSTAEILVWIDAADRSAGDALPFDLRARVAQTMDGMASILVHGGYPVDVALDEPVLEPPMAAGPARIWANLRSLLVHFAEPPTREASKPPPGDSSGFLLPDAFTNPEHVQYALKTTAAAMFCYLLYSLLDWPGIHTCYLTCFLVSLTTTGETIEKFALRIVGCLIGAGAGIAAIVFLLPLLTSIAGLLVVVFLGALASAWVAVGSPRIAYAGFQIAFAFFLCVIQGPAPAFDLTIARDRIIGILIGNLVVYLVFTRLWPVSVAERVDAAIDGLRAKLSALRTETPEGRPALVAETQVALGAIERDLELARYEPSSIRPGDHWLRSRQRSLAKVGAIVPLLLLAGCATSSLDMAPSRPDQPWTPAVSETGEILPGAKPEPTSTDSPTYQLPMNEKLATVPSPPEVDHERPHSLAELIDIAQSNNPLTRTAWNTAREAALAAGIARSAYLPKLAATVVRGHLDTHDRNAALGIDTTADGTISALSLVWLLFDFGERQALNNSATQGSVAANIAFTAAHQQVIYDVSIAFYIHSAAQARVDTAARSLQNARDVQLAAEERYGHDIGTVIEVAQARQATAQAQLLEVQAQGAAENAYLALISAMGISPLTKIRVADIADRKLPIATADSVERIVAEALGRRPDVLGAHAAQLAGEENVRAARAEFLPKFFVSATAAYNDGHLDVTAIPSIGEQLPTVNLSQSRRGVTLFAGVTMPIYDGGTRAAVLRQAQAKADNAALALERTQEEAVRQIVAAENAVRTSLSAYDASTSLAAAAQTTFDAALGAYRSGVGSVTDVTLAETQLLQARNASTDAHSAALSAAATLALAAGALGSVPE